MGSRFSLVRYEIQDQILRYVDDHKLAPHDPLPSERFLCKELERNRSTLRCAMGELVDEGFLYQLPGKGYAVSPPKARVNLRTFQSLSQTIRHQGKSFSRKLLSLKTIEANKLLAAKLGLEK